MKRIGYIYKTTNLINGKIYIGQHLREEFDKKYYGSGKLIQFALKKYGKNNFNVEIIEWLDSIEKLNDAEVKFISAYNSINKKIGYNIALGGNNKSVKGTKWSNSARINHEKSREQANEKLRGKKRSEESKLKQSISSKGKKMSKEWCENISKSLKGRKGTWEGKYLPKEIKEKIGVGNRGKKRTEEFKKKNRERQIGKITPDYIKEKISKSLKGRVSPRKGIVMSEEQKLKISISNKGKKKPRKNKNIIEFPNKRIS
jgi:group I intron endonuclease